MFNQESLKIRKTYSLFPLTLSIFALQRCIEGSGRAGGRIDE